MLVQLVPTSSWRSMLTICLKAGTSSALLFMPSLAALEQRTLLLVWALLLLLWLRCTLQRAGGRLGVHLDGEKSIKT